jgi:hypothetical protein
MSCTTLMITLPYKCVCRPQSLHGRSLLLTIIMETDLSGFRSLEKYRFHRREIKESDRREGNVGVEGEVGDGEAR